MTEQITLEEALRRQTQANRIKKGLEEALDRIAELEKALDELIDVCAECDGWEFFPSTPLDKASSVLNKR